MRSVGSKQRCGSLTQHWHGPCQVNKRPGRSDFGEGCVLCVDSRSEGSRRGGCDPSLPFAILWLASITTGGSLLLPPPFLPTTPSGAMPSSRVAGGRKVDQATQDIPNPGRGKGGGERRGEQEVNRLDNRCCDGLAKGVVDYGIEATWT